MRRKDRQFHLLLLPGASRAQSNASWSYVTYGGIGRHWLGEGELVINISVSFSNLIYRQYK